MAHRGRSSDPFWNPPPPGLSLAPDEVHAWRASLDRPESELEALEDVLAPDERSRAARFRQAKDRSASIVGRSLLRTLLGRYLGVAPQSLAFVYNAHGRPELPAAPEAGRLRFNLSHSGSLVLLAFARERQVGIDVERPGRPLHFESIAGRFFSAAETAALFALPEPERRAAFFRCWTRKEAFIKGTGHGIAYGLDRFDVTLRPDEPARVLRAERDDAALWSLCDLPAGPGYAAALAVEGGAWSLRAWQAP